MKERQRVIAIDGPAGAGKSTIAKILAKAYNLRYLDTGAMYRALALKALNVGIDPHNPTASTELIQQTEITFGAGDPQAVFLDGQDVTQQIRTPEVAEAASAISTHAGVRQAMVARQKLLVDNGGVTLEGRDATTIIAPNADYKFYLTASLEERTQRRLKELQERGQTIEVSELRHQIVTRDHRDVTREESPLILAPDAILIETGGLTIPEVIDKMITYMEGVPQKSEALSHDD
jgi:cytidylate kinase